jgi:hypothetical protein
MFSYATSEIGNVEVFAVDQKKSASLSFVIPFKNNLDPATVSLL